MAPRTTKCMPCLTKASCSEPALRRKSCLTKAAQRIEAARRLFPRIWFNQVTTQPGIDALGAYHAKRDEGRLVDLGPEHDWASHAADAFGMMCIMYEEPVSRPDRPYRHRFHNRSWLSI